MPLADRFEDWSRQYHGSPCGRALYRVPIALWRLGLGRVVGRPLVLVTVTGRSSGLPRRTPLTPHVVGGRTYLWCPYGGRSQWYRNLTADPVATVQSHRGAQVVRAVRIEDDDEVAQVIAELRRFDPGFLRLYLEGEGIADTPQDIAGNKQRLHIRRLDLTSEDGPPPLEADLAWLWLVPVAVAAWRVRRRCARPSRRCVR
jgi:deazaflavin-dependent oxidoreductase (nitroreductase family)